MATIDLTALGNFLSTVNTSVSGGLASLNGNQLGGLISGAGSLLGPSTNAQALGGLLVKFQAFYNAGNTMGMMMIEAQIAGLTGFSTAVEDQLAVVWQAATIPSQPAQLAAAIANVKVAAGV